jgi:large subunit ribosomal protein L25
MSQEVTIEVQHREGSGKNESRRVRRAGLIPAVVYGGGREAEGVVVDPRPIGAVLESERGKNTLIHLRIGDRELKRMVMIREIQRHPVTDRILHADFVRVEMDRKTEVNVPIHLLGTPVGVTSEGGMVEWVHRAIAIRVLPGDIPEHLEADVSELHVGQHLEAGQLNLPSGAELMVPAGETVITILAKKAEEAATAAPSEPGAETETKEGEGA